jgi:hypothetical protein
MTTRIMNRLLGAVALGLAIAGGNIAADASVRLSAEQLSGMPSLAPLLNQVKAAVVTLRSLAAPGWKRIPANAHDGPPAHAIFPPIVR